MEQKKEAALDGWDLKRRLGPKKSITDRNKNGNKFAQTRISMLDNKY